MSVQLYDFKAEWCGPCKSQKPIVEEVDEEYDNLDVTFVDIEDDPETAAEYSVSSLPTLILTVDDEVVEHFVGLTPKDELAEAVETHL